MAQGSERSGRKPYPFLNKEIGSKELEAIEEKVLHSVNKLISSQEIAIASYESRPDQSDDLNDNIRRIKAYNSALNIWIREFLIEKGRDTNPERIFALIEKLQKISRSYGEMRWGAKR